MTVPELTMTELQPTSWNDLIPPATDRLVCVGQTGSGKTTLMEHLCASRAYVVTVDFKGTLAWAGYELHTSLSTIVDSKAPRLCYRPTYGEMTDEGLQARFWEWVYRRQNTTVYVDETAAVTRGDEYPFYYGACLMRGRELGIELWSSTQRPTRIPQIVLSESEHVFAFRLRLPQDRKRVEDCTGVSSWQIAQLAKRQFLYAPQDGAVLGPLTLALP